MARWPAARQRPAVRFDAVRFTYPGRRVPALSDVSFRMPAGSDGGAGRRLGRGKDDDRQSAAAVLGPGDGAHHAGRDGSAS